MERASSFFSGNEAIAHGAVRAGAGFACGYPGTPSTEIIEATAAARRASTAEWCVNEKVALETAVGASLAGVRSHRHHEARRAQRGRRPVHDPVAHRRQRRPRHRLAPTTPACTRRRTSRTTATTPSSPRCRCSSRPTARRPTTSWPRPSRSPRSSTRRSCCARPRGISHGRGQVLPRVPVERASRASYERDISKYVMVPQYARAAEPARAGAPREAARARRGDARSTCSRRAPPTSASSPRASPTPTRARPSPRPGSSSWACRTRCPYAKVAQACIEHVSRVAVVEELDPFIEEQVRALGLPVVGKEAIPADGELDQEIVFRALEPYLLRRPPRRRRPVMPPEPRISPRRRSRRRICPCGRRCSARAARTAPCTPRCAGTSSRRWATSAATRWARCRRCWRSTAASAWAPASA